MEAWQSGLLHCPGKAAARKDPEVQILPLPPIWMGGRVRLMALASKASRRESVSRVQILPHPPNLEGWPSGLRRSP